jgi:hypothetical protein
MSEESKKVEKSEPAATELSEQDLNKVDGGTSPKLYETTVPTISNIDTPNHRDDAQQITQVT